MCNNTYQDYFIPNSPTAKHRLLVAKSKCSVESPKTVQLKTVPFLAKHQRLASAEIWDLNDRLKGWLRSCLSVCSTVVVVVT